MIPNIIKSCLQILMEMASGMPMRWRRCSRRNWTKCMTRMRLKMICVSDERKWSGCESTFIARVTSTKTISSGNLFFYFGFWNSSIIWNNYSYEEFLQQTKKKEFEQDQGWQGLDDQKLYTHEEYLEFERKRQEEVQKLIAQGLVSTTFIACVFGMFEFCFFLHFLSAILSMLIAWLFAECSFLLIPKICTCPTAFRYPLSITTTNSSSSYITLRFVLCRIHFPLTELA